MSILDGPQAQQPVQVVTPPSEQQTITQQQVAPVADVLNPGAQPAQQSGGFLNDLGVNWDDVPTNNNPSDGTHRCFVVKSEIRTKKKDQSKQWVFTFKVADGEPEAGRTQEEWRPIPAVNNGKFATEKDETNARWLKQRLMSLGVPETRVGQVTPADVQGTEVYVTFKTNTTNAGTFQNVTNVKLASEVPQTLSSQTQQVQGLI